jgi:signal transduction histidine kinase
VKTRLLLIMASLLVLSVSSLFLLHLYSERRLLSEIRDYTDDLAAAIEVAQEQPAQEGDPQAILGAYADKLRRLGVKDVSLADASAEVQASTNPANVGKKLTHTRVKGPHQYVLRGVLGEETGPPGSQRTTTLTLPIVVGDRRVGFLVVTRYLDDFSALSREALLSGLVATLAVFTLGFLLALFVSRSLSRPLEALTRAAGQVAAGDLSAQVPGDGAGEVGSLARSFNHMVGRLRESRQLEERLQMAERSNALGRLAAALAHEIRNPLNSINLSIDHVRERLAPSDVPRNAQFERILGGVKQEIARLNALVGDFLNFGRPLRMRPRACAIPDVIREVADLVDVKARDQNVRLQVEADATLPEVVADPELLKTCLLNLMLNALDAMPNGGDLGVRVSEGAQAGAPALLLSVQDSGPGLTPEDARAAFEPYFSTKETGLGLGLALTRKIVTDHGGSIELSSAAGQGTTAEIVLPLRPPPGAAARASA